MIQYIGVEELGQLMGFISVKALKRRNNEVHP